MSILLKERNIVLAGNFIPSKFDKLFFVKNSIFLEDEMLPGSLNTINSVQILTAKFNLIIIPQQLILSALSPELTDDKINEVLISIIKNGDIIGANAAGINFYWNMVVDGGNTLEKMSKSHFYNEKNPLLSKFFNTNDSMYGLYVSKNFKNSRLKLDIKPQKIKELQGQSEEEVVSFVFNFHFDINKKEDYSELTSILEKYNEYRAESESIIGSYK